ncbi:Smr/MutS family protein [Mycoplasma sp. Pen4]|uniref:Smr/MutS family protein n=1 Tax=Mycoplasma sp. Pen4 TaxID=640330 RepID=UPI001654B757|nr:Smr/MutS family protein [Mycoplasma sp. Pen4]QNM93486.1 Smr/MutS family protein [Mycoplasma sp. Pen4]
MRTVDLHGLRTEEAMIEVVNQLYELDNHKISSITFITGNGTGALKAALESLLEKNNYNYSIFNNGGAYIVTLKETQNNYYIEDEGVIDDEDIEDIFNDIEI